MNEWCNGIVGLVVTSKRLGCVCLGCSITVNPCFFVNDTCVPHIHFLKGNCDMKPVFAEPLWFPQKSLPAGSAVTLNPGFRSMLCSQFDVYYLKTLFFYNELHNIFPILLRSQCPDPTKDDDTCQLSGGKLGLFSTTSMSR